MPADWRFKRKVEELEVKDLRRLVTEGMESGPSVEAETVFTRLQTKYSDL